MSRIMGRSRGLILAAVLISQVPSIASAGRNRRLYYHANAQAVATPEPRRPAAVSNIVLRSLTAKLVPCPKNASQMCRLDGGLALPIFFQPDGTFVVWFLGGYRPIELELGKNLLQSYPRDQELGGTRAAMEAKYGSPPVVVPPKQHVRNVPRPEPRKATPTPTPPPAPPSFHKLPEGWFTQRDQGSVGTCHAFAIAPTLDARENRKGDKLGKFAVSENWLVFVSVLDRLCDGAENTDVHTGNGHFTYKNLARLKKIGYCAEPSFGNYQAANLVYQPEQSLAQNAPSLFSEAGAAASSDSILFRRYIASLENERGTSVPGFDILTPSFQNEMAAQINPLYEDKFKAAFGISSKYIEKFCKLGTAESTGRETASELLAGTDASPEFRQCLASSLTRREELKKCDVTSEFNIYVPSPHNRARRIERIKEILREGKPVIVSVKNYGELKRTDSHHALSIVGYDDKRGEFLTLNSWGKDNNFPIGYERIDDISGFSHLSCGD